MRFAQLLVVDDDPSVRSALRAVLPERPLLEAGSKAEGLAMFRAQRPSIVFLDVHLPDGDGLDLLEAIECLEPGTRVVVITGEADVGVAVRAMRAGAFDFLPKPLSPASVLAALASAEQGAVEDEPSVGLAGIVGESPALMEALERIRLVATSGSTTALVLGESGTGKELAARAIHLLSDRADGPFVAVDCTTLPEGLLEAELFGYERGAFTGARAEGKKGLFEVASGGSILLDEIGDARPALQAALLRVIEHRTTRRVGGVMDRPVGARVIASTNRDLAGEVRAGRFRLDLFFRLFVVPVVLPPLRERRGDVPRLAAHFLAQVAGGAPRRPRTFTPPALEALDAHGWPGNVRELRNTIDRAALLAGAGPIEPRHLQLELTAGLAGPSPAEGITLPTLALEDAERRLVERALAVTSGNKLRAAEALGINRTTLYSKLRALGLEGHTKEEP